MNLENGRKQAQHHGVPWHENLSGVITLRLHDGSTLAFPKAPINSTTRELEAGADLVPEERRKFREDNRVGEILTNTVRAVMRISQRHHQVSTDQRFTPEGRADALKQDHVAAAANLAHDWARLNEYGVTLLERRHEMLKVTQLAPNDLVGGLRDMEWRADFRGLSGEARAARLAAMARGDEDPLPLLRSPIATGEAERVAQTAWRSRVESLNREAVEQLNMDEEQLRWGQLLARRVAERVAGLIGVTGYSLYELAAQGGFIVEPGGPEVFFPNAAEAAAYRARWRARQAKVA